LIAISSRDAVQGFFLAEELGQIPAWLLPNFQRRRFNIWTRQDVAFKKLAQDRPLDTQNPAKATWRGNLRK
jgi:hypothetical protein